MNPGQSFNPLLFFPPAMCDMTATSIMYVGKYVAKCKSADEGLFKGHHRLWNLHFVD